MIGNSLIKKIKAKDPDRLNVICRPGSTISSIQDCIQKETTKYKEIVIVAGSIDCADPSKTSAVITGEIRNLLTEAKGHSNHVHFSSVLPRSDGSIQLKIDTVNEAVKKVFREQLNCYFIDNDGTFEL